MPWSLDLSHTNVLFEVKHMGISTVRGRFRTVSGTVQLDEQDLTRSTVEAQLDASSVDTNNEGRDNHLRGPDFLDVANHPNVTFKSRRVELSGKNRYKIYGDLVIRGVTRPVTVRSTLNGIITDTRGRTHAGFSLQTTISRKEFGLPYDSRLLSGLPVTDDKIKLSIETEAIKVLETPAA